MSRSVAYATDVGLMKPTVRTGVLDASQTLCKDQRRGAGNQSGPFGHHAPPGEPRGDERRLEPSPVADPSGSPAPARKCRLSPPQLQTNPPTMPPIPSSIQLQGGGGVSLLHVVSLEGAVTP